MRPDWGCMTYVNRDEPDLDAVQREAYESLLLEWTSRRRLRRLPLPTPTKRERKYAVRTLRVFRIYYNAFRTKGTPLEMSLGSATLAYADQLFTAPVDDMTRSHGVHTALWTVQGMCKGFHAAVRQVGGAAGHDWRIDAAHWDQTRTLLRDNRSWLESAFVVLERDTQPAWTHTASQLFEKALHPDIQDLFDFLLVHQLDDPIQHFEHDETKDMARYQAWHEVLGILVALDICAYQDQRFNQQ